MAGAKVLSTLVYREGPALGHKMKELQSQLGVERRFAMGGGTLYHVVLGEGEGWLSQQEAALSS